MKTTPFAILLILLATGCSTSHNVGYADWQHGVEKYVRDYGKGDPTTLRDVKIPDGHKGFALLGDPLPADSTDAVGLLLGHRPVAGKPSFVYLVGLVDKGHVADIRLAILSVEGTHFAWTLAPSNPSALQSYQKQKESLWRQRFPGRSAPPAEYLNFPEPDDVFTLDTATDRIKVVHQPSGATWTLSVSAREMPRSASLD